MMSAAQKLQDIADLSTLGCTQAFPAPWPRVRRTVAGEEIARACRLHEQALACHAEGNLKEAEPLVLRALEILERELGPDHPDVANVLNCLAGVREEAGDLAAAERLYRRSVVILEWAEEDDPDIIRLRVQSLVSLANVHRNQGRYDEAEPLLCRALTVAEKGLGPADLDTANVLNGLGILHKYQGRFDEAEPLYHRALAIVEATFGPDHLESAGLYHNLGGLEHGRGRASYGESYARRAVEIRERALGSEHPHVAADKAALAAILDAQGMYDEAEELYRQALAVFETVYGPEHYEIAVNLNNLAAIYQARGEAAEAERLYLRALEIKNKILGPEHPDLAMTIHNLATLFVDTGRFRQARVLFRYALGIFARALGPAHPYVLACRERYEETLHRVDRPAVPERTGFESGSADAVPPYS